MTSSDGCGGRHGHRLDRATGATGGVEQHRLAGVPPGRSRPVSRRRRCLASRIAASTLRPARSVAGARQPGHRRAGDVDEPAVPGDVGPQAVAEQRHAADLLHEGQVVDALDVDVVARRPEPGQVSGRQPEHVRVGADVTQGDGRGRGRRRPGERAVEAADLAGCAGQRVEVDDRLGAELTGQGPHGHRGLQRRGPARAGSLLRPGRALTDVEDTRLSPAGVRRALRTGHRPVRTGGPASGCAGRERGRLECEQSGAADGREDERRGDAWPSGHGTSDQGQRWRFDPAPGPLDHTTGHRGPGARGHLRPPW